MPLPITRPGVVIPVPVDQDGRAGPTPGQARGPRWRRVAKNLYVPAGTDSSALDQRIVEAVVGCGTTAAATGWAALAWSGARWFSGFDADGRTPLPVPVAIDDRRAVRGRAGVELTEDWLFADDIVHLDGLPITVPDRSVTFEARRARSSAVAITMIDMAAHADLVDRDSVAAYTVRLGSRPGVVRLRHATDAADENVWSPQETGMRVAWKEVQPLARLRCNAPIFDLRGRHLLTPDLVDPAAGVVGEYDGVAHLGESTFRRDLERDALCRGARPRAGDHDVARPAGHRRLRSPAEECLCAGNHAVRRRALEEHERAVWLRRGAS